jgi:hypothetical protein
MLVVNPRKFAALNTLGSTFFIIRLAFFLRKLIQTLDFSFGFLWGPMAYIQFLFSSPQRRYVTIAYLSTVIGTLYTSLWVSQKYLLMGKG